MALSVAAEPSAPPSPPRLSRDALAAFFRPRNVALVGASDGSPWSRMIAASFDDYGHVGRRFAVNRGGKAAHGLPGYRSVGEISEPVDSVYIFVPAGAVDGALRDAAAAGVRHAVVLSSGFAEAGEDGAALQEQIAATAGECGIVMLGPNSLGFANFAGKSFCCSMPLRQTEGYDLMTDTTSAQSPVLFEMLGDHVALVTLNRPHKRNAINGEMASAIGRIVGDTEDDPAVRVVILRSADDRVFCAGADLSVTAGPDGAAMETPAGGFAGLVYATRTKPWIAAVEGLAVAGGCEICLACDMIVAAQTAGFGLPEVKRGLLAGAGALHRLPNRIPPAIAAEMIATGEPIDAETAARHGLVNRLVPPGETLAAARELAARIVPNAPLAVQYSLTAARTGAALPDGAGRAVVSEWLGLLRKTEDFREGPRAFLEKREPVWKGR